MQYSESAQNFFIVATLDFLLRCKASDLKPPKVYIVLSWSVLLPTFYRGRTQAHNKAQITCFANGVAYVGNGNIDQAVSTRRISDARSSFRVGRRFCFPDQRVGCDRVPMPVGEWRCFVCLVVAHNEISHALCVKSPVSSLVSCGLLVYFSNMELFSLVVITVKTTKLTEHSLT